MHQVIEQEDQFLSTLFIVQQANKNRSVFNLKTLNKYVNTEKFKLESLDLVKTMMKPNDHLMKLDLKDAYYSVLIAEEHRKYLRFQFRGVTYEYQCLPLRFIVSATSLHKTSQASDYHTENIRHTSSDLFGQSTALPPGSSRAPENLQDCNHPFHRSQVRHQTREVLTLTHASNHLSGCTAELARPYNSCSSGETLPHTIGVQRDLDQGVVLHAATLGTAGSDESDCTDWDLGSTIALPSSSTNIHCSPAQERSLHMIKAVRKKEGSILRTQMVVFGETESNQLDGPPPPAIDVII